MYVKCYSSIKLVEFTFFFNIIFMFLISISRLIIKSFFFSTWYALLISVRLFF